MADDLLASLRASLEAVADAPCEACTGDGGRGHTMRGACMGAPCEVCGEARYLHSPGEHGQRVRQQAKGVSSDAPGGAS